jgi:hypothetical protein
MSAAPAAHTHPQTILDPLDLPSKTPHPKGLSLSKAHPNDRDDRPGGLASESGQDEAHSFVTSGTPEGCRQLRFAAENLIGAADEQLYATADRLGHGERRPLAR